MLKIKRNTLLVDPQFGRDTRDGRTVVNASAQVQDDEGKDVGRVHLEIITFPPFKYDPNTFHATVRNLLNIVEVD